MSWVITDKHGNVEENSGFNAFNGGSKLSKKDRLPRILKIQDKFKDNLAPEELAFVTFSLEEVLLKKMVYQGRKKAQMKSIREDLILFFVHQTGNENLLKKLNSWCIVQSVKCISLFQTPNIFMRNVQIFFW